MNITAAISTLVGVLIGLAIGLGYEHLGNKKIGRLEVYTGEDGPHYKFVVERDFGTDKLPSQVYFTVTRE